MDMNHLSWTEYESYVDNKDAIFILPVGAVEQHGPHLPLGTDWMLAKAISDLVAEQVNSVVAAPLAYGFKSQVKSGGGNHFCGTTSLDGHTLTTVICDIMREFSRHGARRVIIIDHHYENDWFITEGCDLTIREMRRLGIDDFQIMKPRLFELIDNDTLERIYPNDSFPGIMLEHAGKFETSEMLYLYPEHVRTDKYPPDVVAKIPPYDLHPADTSCVPPSGALAPVGDACAEYGEAIITEIVDGIASCISDGFGIKSAEVPLKTGSV